MWRQVLLPVVLVGVAWLAVSGATTFYLQWLESSYQQTLDEHVVPIQAAIGLQRAIWELHADTASRRIVRVDWPTRLPAFQQRASELLAAIRRGATQPQEQEALAEIERRLEEYRRQLQAALALQDRPDQLAVARDELYEVASRATIALDDIQKLNQQMLRQVTLRRANIHRVVFWVRALTITLVPILGMALGWWTARRLQRTVTQIQVILHDPSLAEPNMVGTVQVKSGDELTSIQKQVELIVQRLRETGQALQSARNEVLRSERLAAIGGLAAGVAHELRNPLTSVKLLLQHAASQGGTSAVLPAARLSLILEEIDRMEATIQGLLDFSRPATPQRQVHDLRHTLKRAVHLVEGRAEKQHVRREIRLGAQPLMVDGDPQQLHQVFVNLLINAIEAMPQGGTVEVTLDAQPSDATIRLTIRDTGQGIPPELVPRLFEPFASGKERGTGLGLAVSRRILEEHGGTITIRPATPGGTEVVVTLPAVQDALTTGVP
jgi:two-component system sensor histidine kinase HydH